jgi:transcriptional regulator with XRE-family HTH domain
MEFFISAAQSRAARALLGLGLREVAEETGLATNTVARFEKSDERKIGVETALKMANAYRKLGVEFLEGDGVRRAGA